METAVPRKMTLKPLQYLDSTDYWNFSSASALFSLFRSACADSLRAGASWRALYVYLFLCSDGKHDSTTTQQRQSQDASMPAAEEHQRTLTSSAGECHSPRTLPTEGFSNRQVRRIVPILTALASVSTKQNARPPHTHRPQGHPIANYHAETATTIKRRYTKGGTNVLFSDWFALLAKPSRTNTASFAERSATWIRTFTPSPPTHTHKTFSESALR